MGRAPCSYSKQGLNKGPWTPEEDSLLIKFIEAHGEGHWRTLPTKAGLLRCGKGCRLRWMNYLRPNVKRGHISPDEEEMIIRLHKLLGNRWSLIAGRIPGRTDNEIKNYWNTHLSKKVAETNVHKAFNPKPYQHKEDNSENDLYFEHRKSQGEIAHRQLNDHNTVKESGYSHFPAMNGDQDAVMQDTGSAFSDIQHIVSILMGSEDLIHNPTEMKGHVPLATPQLNALQGSTPDVNFGQNF